MSELNYSKKQIKPLIDKYAINPETNVTFQAIIKMFDGQTNYQIWAIKAVFDNIATIEIIQNIKHWADENQTAIQNLVKGNIVAYKTKNEFKGLHDEIIGINNIKIVKHEIEKFNTDQRNEFTEACFKNINNGLDAFNSKEFAEWVDLFKKFSSLNNKTQKKLIISVSAFRGDISKIVEVIKGAFETRYDWNKVDLLGFIARNCDDCTVVFENDNIIIARIGSYSSSVKLCGNGRTTWCLTNRKSYWDSYVGNYKDRSQYFLWDFSRREDHELAHIGFTVSMRDGIVEAQSTQNACLRGSGMQIDGKMWNINDVFSYNKIPTDIYIKLGELKHYTWNIDSFLTYVNSKKISVICQKNAKIVLQANSKSDLTALASHTLMRNDREISKTNKCYVIFDFSKTKDNGNSVAIIYYNTDRYGMDKFASAQDALGNNLTKEQLINIYEIRESEYLNMKDIDVRILLHKYIDEKNEADAIRIIEENGDKFDVNYIHNQTAPIFSAIDNRMLNLFSKLYSHKNFNNKITDAHTECILAYLMYDYAFCQDTLANCKKNNDKIGTDAIKSEIKNLETMINIVLDDESTDFNYVNFGMDTPVNIAAESPFFNWILERLVSNPNVNMNQYNDFNFSAIGNAIRKGNVDGIKIIGQRKDVAIRKEDIELATRMNINLDELIDTSKVSNKSKTNATVNQYRQLFEMMFANKNN